ncbi:MAG: metallophosphoesterase [Breznakibacter sp.]
MMKAIHLFIVAAIGLALATCKPPQATQNNKLQVAFLADVHLQNLYGQLTDNSYKGVLNPNNGQHVLARTMNAQLHSTRLFNENYFAFLAALDDIVRRGVKYVVLPGDFSDDGQPLNVHGLRTILDDYSAKYGIKFLATTGNHDPVRPFTMDAGKIDYLGENGQAQALMSKEGLYKPVSADALPVVITRDVRKMGYHEIVTELADFGFFPQKSDLYWETPFTTYGYNDYSYSKASAQSSLDQRTYLIAPPNVKVPDVSYLVEPIPNVWFLAIDANVYIPNEAAANAPLNPTNFDGASVGYHQVLSHKKHLIDWVKRVTSQAAQRSKTLIVFSHFPMVEFNDGASESIRKIMGNGNAIRGREPGVNVSTVFADAGIRLHFGGHMHMNDTGIFTGENGNTLVNVQIPSLAAYVPAYKLLTVKSNDLMDIQTIVLDSVPRFKELFPLYEMEHNYLEGKGEKQIWDKSILSARSYREYTMWHLKELVRMRYIPTEWPSGLSDILLHTSGIQLLKFVYASAQIDSLANSGLNISKFDEWTGFDLVYDFYRIQSADQLAFDDIGTVRLQQYKAIMEGLKQKDNVTVMGINLKEFASVFDHLTNGEPANHFTVNTKTGEVVDIK